MIESIGVKVFSLHFSVARSNTNSLIVRTLKEKWLLLYAGLPESQELLKSETYNKFLKESEYWIESYALFRALKKKNDRKFWGDWPETHTMDKEAQGTKLKTIAETPTYKKLLQEYAKDITFYQFLQLLSAQQLTQARDYANSKGVWLKGDVPFLCSKDSADVWYVHKLQRVEFRLTYAQGTSRLVSARFFCWSTS